MFLAKVNFNNKEVEKELNRAEELVSELMLASMRLHGFINPDIEKSKECVHELHLIAMRLNVFLNLELEEVQSDENTSKCN